MTHKRAFTYGISAMATLVSLGVLGFGCAGGEDTNSAGGVPCVPEDELCGDQYDNDCDGLVDEDCECNPGATQPCYTGPEGTEGKGACAPGEQTCGPNGKWGGCVGEALPAAADACDGVDNDCDGMIDPGCACSPPVPETTQPCYTGPEGTEGVGDCTPGFQICLPDGTWDTECILEVLPGEEACDNFDNDCDGEVDDMGMKTCGVGACQVSVITCTAGKLTPCMAKPPSVEACDGVDNDCDQLTDESDPSSGKTCDSGLLGACKAGKLACEDGQMVCTPGVQPGIETCDGADNDCDGVVDDNIQGTGGSCSTGYPGICSMGAIQCQNNTIDCFPIVAMAPEVCNGIDDDCNGDTDEDNPEGGVVCDTGTPGVCAAGKTNCVNGAIECTPDVTASAETCGNMIDENCNGLVDEPTPEACDGIDNDCNGVIDNGNPEGGTACDAGQSGACGLGLTRCEGAQLVCKSAAVLFSDDFSKGNSFGWTLGTEWAIGPTAASTGHSSGFGDPAQDHSATADNNVAGVVLGGNASTAVHGYRYLTSPVIDASQAGSLYIEFWRWLNSDFTPFMHNVVEVWNGEAWSVVWQTGSSATTDNAWIKQSYNVTGFKNAQFQFRFGFNVDSPTGVWSMSQWNVDDVVLTTTPGCL